jgi:hypothetical protein
MPNALRLVQHWSGVVALVVALGGSAVATIEFVKLGAVNKSASPTGLVNTGAGPALSLNVKRGQPPLSVNSSKRVDRLNASRLQGQTPSSFAPAAGSPNDLSRDGAQLLDFSAGGGTTGPGTLYRRIMVAPGSGSIALSASGNCSVNKGGFDLSALIDGGGYGYPVEPSAPGHEACVVTFSKQVTKGQEVDLEVSWAPFNSSSVNQGYADAIATFVYFTP